MCIGYGSKHNWGTANPICVGHQHSTVAKAQGLEPECLAFNAGSFLLTSSVTLGKPLSSQSLSFAVCKMKKVTVPASCDGEYTLIFYVYRT